MKENTAYGQTAEITPYRLTSCYSNRNDRPHRRRTDHSIVLDRWRQCAPYQIPGSFGSREFAAPNGISIGSAVRRFAHQRTERATSVAVGRIENCSQLRRCSLNGGTRWTNSEGFGGTALVWLVGRSLTEPISLAVNLHCHGITTSVAGHKSIGHCPGSELSVVPAPARSSRDPTALHTDKARPRAPATVVLALRSPETISRISHDHCF